MNELKNFVHHKIIGESSIETIMLDNIAHELLKLNETIGYIKEALQLISIKS